MSSAEDVQNTNGILTLPRFQKCMGRVPSDEKIPDDMSDEGKCTVNFSNWKRTTVLVGVRFCKMKTFLAVNRVRRACVVRCLFLRVN